MKQTVAFLRILALTLPCIFSFGQKETIILGKISATSSVLSQSPTSLNAYLEAMPVHFKHYLNQTGKFSVIEIDQVVSQSNLDLELETSDIFKTTQKQQIDKPKYMLDCTVVEFSEKETSLKNPLDGSTRLNRDIFVSVTMQLINRENPSDQKSFEVPTLNESWDEDLFGPSTQRDFQSRKMIDAFAKSSARTMSESFVEGFQQKLYLYGKTGNECTLLAGYQNGVERGQFYDVYVSKPIIHPVTQKPLSGTQVTKIGLIEVIDTQVDVATCRIVEDFGINTDVSPENLPVARISTTR